MLRSPNRLIQKRLSHSIGFLDDIVTLPKDSRVFSLIQPTGAVHLGNYLGALSNWKKLSDKVDGQSKCFFGTADLHSLTQAPDQSVLRENRYGAIANIIASGVDPDKCVVFHQLSVPEHLELFWIFTCLTSMGALNRMTQWKLKVHVEDKSNIYSEQVMGKTKAGFLLYPVLQAADVLLYNATHVPVGEDQSQHLELCRDIGAMFNHNYGDFFTLPRTILTPTKRISALRNPSKKMSKSDTDQSSSVYMVDDADTIAKKFRKAVTDSVQGPITYDPVTRPGVSNIVSIIAGLENKSVEDTVAGLAWVQNHKQLKDHVTELVVEEFKEKKALYDRLMLEKNYIDAICEKGRQQARAVALANLLQIKQMVGL